MVPYRGANLGGGVILGCLPLGVIAGVGRLTNGILARAVVRSLASVALRVARRLCSVALNERTVRCAIAADVLVLALATLVVTVVTRVVLCKSTEEFATAVISFAGLAILLLTFNWR